MTFKKLIKEYTLKHGGTVLVTHFPSSDNVIIVGSIAGGSRLAGSRALAEAHAAMLLEGTARRSKYDIQVLLDRLGASLSFSAGRERLVFSALCRSEDVKTLLSLICEALTEPAFPARELTAFKKREVAALSLELQETHVQARIGLARELFTPSHPNYADTTAETLLGLETISSRDLRAYHARAVDAATLVLSLAGDVPDDAVRLAEKASGTFFGLRNSLRSDTSSAREKVPGAFSAALPSKAHTIHTHIPDKASVSYELGITTGMKSDDPDYAALRLGIQILGNRGGFTGRLMSTVREIDGLTYFAYAQLAGSTRLNDGFISIFADFAPQLLSQGDLAMRREITRIVSEGVTKEEVQKHAHLYEARLRTATANSASLASLAHSVAIEGFSPDHLDTFAAETLTLSTAKVNAALKKYLTPTNLTLSTAGPAVEALL